MKSCLSEDILQAYLDRELTREVSDDLVAHLAECAACAARVCEAEQTWMAIDGAWTSALPESIPTARLRARIESALAESTAPTFTLVWLWNWKMVVMAATLLLTFSVWLFQPTQKLPQHQQTVVPTPVNMADTQVTSPIPPSERLMSQQVLQPRKRVPRRSPASKAPVTEIVTPFFPLREGEDFTALESMQLVRVELPGSALSEIGILVDPETAQIPVKADVVLGQDGLARAIRFVR